MAAQKADKRGKRRVDAVLVEEKLAPSLDRARALIMAGQVVIDQRRAEKSSDWVFPGERVRLKKSRRFVSRGGEKLYHAIEDLGLASAFLDAVVFDVGASTGGFTDCCLSLGARHVVALDVGSNQLAWRLRMDPRVTSREKTDVRVFDPTDLPAPDWLVADISFNSLENLAPALRRIVSGANCQFLLLVKPQFELPAENVPKGGVVTDQRLHSETVTRVIAALESVGIQAVDVRPSRVLGAEGNQEFFIWAQLKSNL